MTDFELEEKTKSLKPGERLITTYEKTTIGKSPPYITVGNGLASKNFPSDLVIDAFQVFSQLSKAQQQLFLDFKDILILQQIDNYYAKRAVKNPNLICLEKGDKNDLHKSIRSRMSQNRNGQMLQKNGVLKKIKNGVYMLNPYLFIPFKNFEEVARLWAEID
jgi:hypothetical protein